MIVKKELVVANWKKADIISDLRKKNFRPSGFPKVTKAKASGETEDAEEKAKDEKNFH